MSFFSLMNIKSFIFIISLCSFYSSVIAGSMSDLVQQDHARQKAEVEKLDHIANIYWDIDSIADLKQQYITLEDSVSGVDFRVDVEETKKYRDIFKKLAGISGKAIDLVYVPGSEPFAEIRDYDGHLKVALSLSLINVLDNESEFAFVCAHELVHVTNTDIEDREKRQTITSTVKFAGALVGTVIPLFDLFTDVAAESANLTYTVDDEIKADTTAVRWVKEAGHDPYAAIKLFERLISRSKNGENNYITFYGSVDCTSSKPFGQRAV